MMGYEVEIERKMQRLFATLSEKDKRRYAAVEVEKLEHGGINYISTLFGIDPKTINRGRTELEQAETDETKGRIRKKGAVRNAKSKNALN